MYIVKLTRGFRGTTTFKLRPGVKPQLMSVITTLLMVVLRRRLVIRLGGLRYRHIR